MAADEKGEREKEKVISQRRETPRHKQNIV